MASRWHETVKVAPMYNVRDGSAVDLEMDSQIPSEIRRSVHNEATALGSPLSDSARDRNCANKSKNQNEPGGEVTS